ncbi:MAG: RDD family protein [Acidimicrobiia bacterium]|nr:RDD family protein [Acidimicrobiia bacterium]
MASTEFRWCPRCGDEFQRHVTTCPDCALALRTEPRPVPEARPGPVAPLTYDLAAFSAAARRTLVLHVAAAGFPHQWHGSTLAVPAGARSLVESLIDEAEPFDGEPVALEAADGARPPNVVVELPIARRRARIFGAYVDAAAFGLILLAAGEWIAWPDQVRRFGAVAIGFRVLYDTVCVGVAATTPGKAVARLEVHSALGGRPAWTQAAVRAVVPFALGVVADLFIRVLVQTGAAPPFDVVAVVLYGLCWGTYLPILWDPQRRGLHDRVAGTVVRVRPIELALVDRSRFRGLQRS